MSVDVVLCGGQVDSHVRTLLDDCLADLRVPAVQLYTQHTHRTDLVTETLLKRLVTLLNL